MAPTDRFVHVRVKAKDIAAALHLSEATVSLALNQKSGVSKATRQRVLDYVQAVYGTPSHTTAPAPQPVKGTVLMITYVKHGIIMDRDISVSSPLPPNNFFAQMKDIACGYGYDFEDIRFYAESDSLGALLQKCRSKKVRGIYFLAAEMNQNDLLPFLDLHIPLVTGDNLFYEAGADSYLIDNHEGICRGVDYLVDKGHSHILYLAEDIDIFNFHERREAFIQEMASRNCGNARGYIKKMGSTVEDVYHAMGSYLDRGVHKTSAFVLESSVVSLGVIKAMLERNIRIPRDYSLLGFDALPSESIQGISLTLIKGTHTMRHKAALRHLIRRIEGESEEIMRVYYKTRLIEGDTVFDKTRYIYTK